jgi:hypothetical protein
VEGAPEATVDDGPAVSQVSAEMGAVRIEDPDGAGLVPIEDELLAEHGAGSDLPGSELVAGGDGEPTGRVRR